MINSNILRVLCLWMFFLLLLSPPSAEARKKSSSVFVEISTGNASYYSDNLHGQATASGEKHDKDSLVAAHRTLQIGTIVRVTNLHNGRHCLVRINDRGPSMKSRIIDVSQKTAHHLHMLNRGVAKVKVEVVSDKNGHCRSSNAFYVSIAHIKKISEAKTVLSHLQKSATKSTRTLLKSANTFQYKEPGHSKKLFVGFGPFTSYHEAERHRIDSNTEILCLPRKDISVK